MNKNFRSLLYQAYVSTYDRLDEKRCPSPGFVSHLDFNPENHFLTLGNIFKCLRCYAASFMNDIFEAEVRTNQPTALKLKSVDIPPTHVRTDILFFNIAFLALFV